MKVNRCRICLLLKPLEYHLSFNFFFFAYTLFNYILNRSDKIFDDNFRCLCLHKRSFPSNDIKYVSFSKSNQSESCFSSPLSICLIEIIEKKSRLKKNEYLFCFVKLKTREKHRTFVFFSLLIRVSTFK